MANAPVPARWSDDFAPGPRGGRPRSEASGPRKERRQVEARRLERLSAIGSVVGRQAARSRGPTKTPTSTAHSPGDLAPAGIPRGCSAVSLRRPPAGLSVPGPDHADALRHGEALGHLDGFGSRTIATSSEGSCRFEQHRTDPGSVQCIQYAPEPQPEPHSNPDHCRDGFIPPTHGFFRLGLGLLEPESRQRQIVRCIVRRHVAKSGRLCGRKKSNGLDSVGRRLAQAVSS